MRSISFRQKIEYHKFWDVIPKPIKNNEYNQAQVYTQYMFYSRGILVFAKISLFFNSIIFHHWWILFICVCVYIYAGALESAWRQRLLSCLWSDKPPAKYIWRVGKSKIRKWWFERMKESVMVVGSWLINRVALNKQNLLRAHKVVVCWESFRKRQILIKNSDQRVLNNTKNHRVLSKESYTSSFFGQNVFFLSSTIIFFSFFNKSNESFRFRHIVLFSNFVILKCYGWFVMLKTAYLEKQQK